MTTPGINSWQELAEFEGIDIGCLGGRLRSISRSFVGLTESALDRMSFERVFLGADVATAEDGICEADYARLASEGLWPGVAVL